MKLPTIYDSLVQASPSSEKIALSSFTTEKNRESVRTASALKRAGYLTDLLDFMSIDKVAFFGNSSNLIHKSSKDFWAVETDENGFPVVKRCANLEEVQA